MGFHPLDRCVCCGSDNLYRWLDLGMQPSANAYHKGEGSPSYPLEVNRCLNCFHSQLSGTVDPEELFRTYAYVSGTSETFRKHCMDLATEAVEKCGKTAPLVLDIACSDGTLMECFRLLGCNVCGIDPARNLWEVRSKKGLKSFIGYWNYDTRLRLFGDKAFDIITAQNVLGHVRDPKGFLDTCAYALRSDGFLVTEFPNGADVIQSHHWDYFYHDHVSLFNACSFDTLTEWTNLEVDDARVVPIHGGSLRSYLRLTDESQRKEHSSLFPIYQHEWRLGIYDDETYDNLASHVCDLCRYLKRILDEYRGWGYRVCGFGASAKGNTLLNTARLDLDFIVDENPLKQGYLTPGRNIPIVAPEHLKDVKETLAVLLLAWNFKESSLNCIRKHRDIQTHDRSITYVPDVREETLR